MHKSSRLKVIRTGIQWRTNVTKGNSGFFWDLQVSKTVPRMNMASRERLERNVTGSRESGSKPKKDMALVLPCIKALKHFTHSKAK